MSDDFELVRPFFIDNGEISGFGSKESFVLGYECAEVDALIDSGDPFICNIHPENLDRIKWKLDKECREYGYRWLPEDAGETWIELGVNEDKSENDD